MPFSKVARGVLVPPVWKNSQKVEAVSNSSVKYNGGVGSGATVGTVVADMGVGRSIVVGVDIDTGLVAATWQAAVRVRHPKSKINFFMSSPFNIVRPAV